MIRFTKPQHGIRVPAVSRRFATGHFDSIATVGASAAYGPRKTSGTNDEAPTRNGFSSGLFRRDDRI